MRLYYSTIGGLCSKETGKDELPFKNHLFDASNWTRKYIPGIAAITVARHGPNLLLRLSIAEVIPIIPTIIEIGLRIMIAASSQIEP
jgi:hypothetical protein